MRKTYRIRELAEEFDVTYRTLRFYEGKGLLFPKRIRGTRIYSESDRQRLKLTLLGRRVGLSVLEIQHLLSLYNPIDNSEQLQAALAVGERQLADLRTERDRIEGSIAELDRLLSDMKGKLRGITRC